MPVNYGFQGYSAPGQSQSSGQNQSSGSSQSSTQIVPGMMGVYSDLLGRNQANYGNVLSAYTQGAQQQNTQLPGIYGGYKGVQSGVMDTLGMGAALGKNGNWGVAQPAATAIGNSFQQAQANTAQQMTNAGLGNTTAVGSAQNQNAQAAAQQYGALGAQLAQTAAGYQSQIGQAGLGARMQGLGLQSQLAAQRGSTLGGYHFANTAGSLTGGFGSSQQSGSGDQQSRAQGQSFNPNGQGSGQMAQFPQIPGDRSPAGFNGGAGAGGGGYSGGGASGMPGYNFGGSSGGGGSTTIGDGIQRQGGNFSYGQNWGPAGEPGADFSGQMNQQPSYQQGEQTDANPGGFQSGDRIGQPYDPASAKEGDTLPGGYKVGGDTRWNVVGPKNVPVPKDATPEQRAAMLKAHGVNPNDPAYR